MGTEEVNMVGQIPFNQILLSSKNNFYMRMTPVVIFQQTLKKWQSDLIEFLWARKQHQVPSSVLNRNTRDGGLQLPDVSKYYMAIHLSMILWYLQAEGFWDKVYRKDTYPYELKGIVWISPSEWPSGVKYPYLHAALQIWDKWKVKLLPEMSLYTVYLGRKGDNSSYRFWKERKICT